MARSLFIRFGVAVCCLMLAGCGGGNPEIAPVQGKVVFNGQPMANVTVTFMKVGAPRHSFGETNENGEFSLTTFDPQDGAYIGLNKVVVSQPAEPVDPAAGVAPPPVEVAPPPKPPVLPVKYNQITTTDLTAEVQAGTNQLELQLLPMGAQ